MQTYNIYYDSKEQFYNYLEKNSIQDNNKLLIQIFTSLSARDAIATLLDTITSFLPQATIIGATTDGEICEGEVTTDTTVISLTQFQDTQLKVAIVQNCLSSEEYGEEIAKQLSVDDAKIIITFSDGLSMDGEEYLNGIYSINHNILTAGGMAGDGGNFLQTYIFTKDTIISQGAVGVALINPQLQIQTDYSFDWLSIGKSMTITEVKKNRVYTIDNISAHDIYKKYLGEDIAKGLPAIGIEYPMIIQRANDNLARAVLATHEDGSLSFAGDFKVGDIVKIGYGNAQMILNHSKELKSKIEKKPIESIFIYSCMARRRFMPDRIGLEIIPLTQIANVAGFFTYGEFFSLERKNELLNQTMTILALSESKEIQNREIELVPNVALNDYQKSIKALSHILDVTTQELAHENANLLKIAKEIQAREDSLNLAQEVGHFGSWEIDLRTKKTIWSKQNYRIYKETSDAVLTLETFMQRLLPEDRVKAMQTLDNLRDGCVHTVELRAKRMDGVIINILLNGKLLFDVNNNPLKMIGTTLDVTQEVQTKLKEREQSQILEQIHDSVVSTDLNEIITHWNNGATLMHGYTALEMIGQSIWILYRPEDTSKVQSVKEIVLRNGFYNHEIKKIRKDGTIIDTDVSLSLLRDENGQVFGITRYSQDITQKKIAEQEISAQNELIYFQDNYDYLTKLPNRNLFNTTLVQTIKNTEKKNGSFVLFLLDLDNFKNINDTFGHEYGDEVLKIVTKRLLSCIQEHGIFARLGGDEFALIVEDILDVERILKIAQTMIDNMREKITIQEQDLYVSVSIGISLYPEDATTKDELLKFADSAMYKAKDEGRNNYQFYASSLTAKAFERVVLESSMRIALVENQFIVYYQPQTDARTDTLIGMEALVRWKHPTIGLISPDKFIPLAEETGMIIPLDRYVMKQAMSDFKNWYDLGLNPGILALNLSLKQLKSPDFFSFLENIISEIGFNVKWLELEITESQMMQDPMKTISILKNISALGIEIAIDDFGTGYSSLAYLKRLPVDKLKIDQSFVRDLPTDEEDCAISKAVIALANSLNLRIIAEGVETKEQKEFLVENGCFNIQGYLYSRPIPYNEMTQYLQ